MINNVREIEYRESAVGGVRIAPRAIWRMSHLSELHCGKWQVAAREKDRNWTVCHLLDAIRLYPPPGNLLARQLVILSRVFFGSDHALWSNSCACLTACDILTLFVATFHHEVNSIPHEAVQEREFGAKIRHRVAEPRVVIKFFGSNYFPAYTVSCWFVFFYVGWSACSICYRHLEMQKGIPNSAVNYFQLVTFYSTGFPSFPGLTATPALCCVLCFG